jgi:autotransporter translocation and assembly factor TamB
LTWEGALPQLDQTQPVEVDISAHRFDAAILAPLLTDVLSELSGDVDAQLHASARAFSEPKGPGGLKQTRWSASIGGTAQLRRGTLQIAPLGMQLNDVEFEAQARDSKGETEIVVANLSARTRSEVPNLRGSARLWIKDLRLQRGAATILLNRPVPILIEGVSRATATGRANVALVRQPDEMQVTVDIPELEAKLPRAMRRNVIRLDNNPEVEITQPIAQPTRGRRSEDALPWLVTFKLGRSVKVTRAGLEIPLRGEPQIRFADQITVGGVIELRPGGRVELLGKAFVIESGIIRFDNPDPSNPNLNVTASWRAPDGTLVLVDVRGTFREATLNLRSDPPIADPAVLQALLLGGSSAEAESTPQTVGIGIGTGWLTDLLSDTPLSGIEFRTASEQTAVHSAYSTYTAAIRLSEEVWFEGSYKRAQSDVVGQQNAFSGTIDWRFKPNWSVRTEAGDVGTKLDLLWRYRY